MLAVYCAMTCARSAELGFRIGVVAAGAGFWPDFNAVNNALSGRKEVWIAVRMSSSPPSRVASSRKTGSACSAGHCPNVKAACNRTEASGSRASAATAGKTSG